MGKHYCFENGTDQVDLVLANGQEEHVISRLTIIELNSVFAKKVRTGTISISDCQGIMRRIQLDVKARTFKVLRIVSSQFTIAEQLIQRHGIHKNIRTLDAIQLAVAINIQRLNHSVRFICADQALCAIAQAEGISVVNPEFP